MLWAGWSLSARNLKLEFSKALSEGVALSEKPEDGGVRPKKRRFQALC